MPARLPPPGLAHRSLPSPLLSSPWTALSSDDDDNPEDELQNWSSLIGIVTAICGNVLIALALNVQRYAHLRLHRKKIQIRERARQATRRAAANVQSRASGQYGAAISSRHGSSGTLNGALNRYAGARYSAEEDARDSSEIEPLAHSFHSDGSTDGDGDGDGDDYSNIDTPSSKISTSYLKDPYWWLGQFLITIGEMGNFLAYGFAPASIVSPLGVVALISNCVIAPIFFKEVFRQRDFWGVIIATTGAVTVVLSAKTEETKLGPHEVWGAITTLEFEIYLAVSCALIVLLMCLSPRYGHKTILIDLGLVGLFGGYTALSTKGVSSMLSSTLFGAFATPVTYTLVFILLFTAIMQVRYVNKALQRFDSTQVIPVQFVLFTLSVIIGSAVLYRDFERTTAEQAIQFVGGCLFTFFGVFLITSGRPRQEDEEEPALSDAEGIEETIGLAEQDRASPPTPPRPRGRGAASRSDGSSRASRVSFSDVDEHISDRHTPASTPSIRKHFLDSSHFQHHYEHDDDERALLLSNPWQEPGSPPIRPSPGIRTISSDSFVSAVQTPSTASIAPNQASVFDVSTDQPIQRAKTVPSSARDRGRDRDRDSRPITPRTPASSSRPPPSHQVYSPSPFSSTVSAVVTDALSLLQGSQAQAQQANEQGTNSGQDTQDSSGNEDDEFMAATRRNSKGGLRGRARSLSQSLRLTGWFGGGESGEANGTSLRRSTLPRRDTASSTPVGRTGNMFGGPLDMS